VLSPQFTPSTENRTRLLSIRALVMFSALSSAAPADVAGARARTGVSRTTDFQHGPQSM